MVVGTSPTGALVVPGTSPTGVVVGASPTGALVVPGASPTGVVVGTPVHLLQVVCVDVMTIVEMVVPVSMLVVPEVTWVDVNGQVERVVS